MPILNISESKNKMLERYFIVVFVTLVMGCSTFAQKAEVRPYTIATTVKKYQKKYPFIKPIQPLSSENILAKENIPYKETSTSVLKLDVYYPKGSSKEQCPGVLLIHGGGWISGSKENQRIMAQHLANNGTQKVAITLGQDSAVKALAGWPWLIRERDSSISYGTQNALDRSMTLT